AEEYGLEFLERNIEDVAGNTTRFLVLDRARDGDGLVARTGRDKTSVAFAMKDRPGALSRMLLPFRKENVNLTKIESRPSRVKSWKYIFFLDMEGHARDGKVSRALAALEKECSFYRLLGSYPRAVEDAI
ncbi:MAG: ACT domain-containing protein, partial [Candidatus Hydrogenedentota bacterium]